MSEIRLRPNDRICIGPSSMFVYKNRQHDEEQSMPDTPDDPITADFASEELLNYENEEANQAMATLKKAQDEMYNKAMMEIT